MAELEDDILLMGRIQKRDRSAFDQVFRRWYPSLLAHACMFLEQKDAEDAVQDVMAYFWEKAPRIHLQGSISAYLHGAVRNRCLLCISRGKVHSKAVSAIKMSVVEETLDTDLATIKDLSIRLQSALGSLPEEQRQAFEMNRFDGRTYAEIAQRTGTPVKTIEWRMSQALRKLRELLAEFI